MDYIFQFQQEIKEKIRHIEESLSTSQASDYAEYKYRIGQIIGMRNCLIDLDRLRKGYNEGIEEE